MSTYRSTQPQRDAVQAMREQYPQLRTLTAPAVWRVYEAMRADLDASLSVDEHIAAVLDDKQILIDGVMDAGKVDRKKASGVARMTEGDLLERFLAGSR